MMKEREALAPKEEVKAAGAPDVREPHRGHSTLFAAEDDAAAAAAAPALSIIDSHPLPSPAVAMRVQSTSVSNANAHPQGSHISRLSKLPFYSRPPELHLPLGRPV